MSDETSDLTIRDLYKDPNIPQTENDNDSVWVQVTPAQYREVYRIPDWRYTKRWIKALAKRLVPNAAYAMGGRGHPGLVTERFWAHWWSYPALFGASVSIRSLVDGVEESCSLRYDCPLPISKEEAEIVAEEVRTMHDADIAVKHGHPLEATKSWIQDWIDRGVLYYVLHDQNGYTVRSTQAFTIEEAEADVARHERLIAGGRYHGNITNPRIVDMLTYPAPIKSFEVVHPVAPIDAAAFGVPDNGIS